MDPDDFPVSEDDISTNRYVSLVAKTNNTDLAIDGEEVKVLVSFSDGIVLLQTDKPIYTPQHSLEYTRGIFNEVLSIFSVSFTLLGVDVFYSLQKTRFSSTMFPEWKQGLEDIFGKSPSPDCFSLLLFLALFTKSFRTIT